MNSRPSARLEKKINRGTEAARAAVEIANVMLADFAGANY
jgi:hypothetical protein